MSTGNDRTSPFLTSQEGEEEPQEPKNGGADQEPDLTGVMWNDKIWLTHNPLTSETALAYFSLSQFYDPTCNNEIIRMQRLDPSLLSRMAGIEYVVSHSQPPSLFVITKQKRSIDSTTASTQPSQPQKTTDGKDAKFTVRPLAVYYISNGNVYQAPNTYQVLNSRISQSLYWIRKAFDIVQEESRFDPDGKHRWKRPTPAIARSEIKWGEGATKADSQAPSVGVGGSGGEMLGKDTKLINQLLHAALEKNQKIAQQITEKQENR